jgi:hypothetical protein
MLSCMSYCRALDAPPQLHDASPGSVHGACSSLHASSSLMTSGLAKHTKADPVVARFQLSSVEVRIYFLSRAIHF